jgi:hypothetical protein
MPADTHAPIFTDCWDLCVWLLKKARTQGTDLLAQSLAEESLRLLDAITMALKNLDREQALDEADVILLRLRLRLRLAVDTALLDDRQGQYALRLADTIGRQLGGWQKSLTEEL